MASKTAQMKNLNTGRRTTTGKRPRTTVWGKLLICECGHRFNTKLWNKTDRQTNIGYQCYDSVRTGSYESRKKKGLPLEGICRTPMIPEWKLQMMANYIFRNYLSEKDKVLALANSMLEAHIDDKEDDVDYAAIIEKKCREVERHRTKLSNFIDMRADGEISKEDYTTKTAEVKEDIAKLSAEIEELQLKLNKEPVITDYRDKLTVLQYALEQYTNVDDSDIPESVIEAFVVKIVARQDGFDWYLRFDGDPNDPLHMKTEGKKRKNCSVSVVGGFPPTKQNCDTWSVYGKVGNLKNMSQLVNYISENNLRTVADLEARVSTQQEKLDTRSAACKSIEAKMKETAELLRQAQNYADTKPIYDEWYRIKFKGKKDKFKEEHESELRKYYAAERKLKPHFHDGKLPLTKWRKDAAALESEYASMQREMEALRDDVRNLRQVTLSVRAADNERQQLSEQNKKRHHQNER